MGHKEVGMNSPVGTLRVLVVDDEAHGRRAVRRLLESEGDSFVIDEACDGTEACEKIASFHPNLLILDIEMPSATGFDVLKMYPNRSFEVIFVTAYSNFAIQAFDSYACDYLLKPVTQSRFSTALARARERLALQQNRSPIDNRNLLSQVNYLDSFFARQGARATQIFCRDIVAISSVEGGTEVQTIERAFVCDFSLAHFEGNLDPLHFCRVRRNVIVHRAAIEKVIHLFPMILVMRNGTEITVAKERRSEVRRWLSDENPDSLK
jgi:two-component system LytT family response regulator